MLVLVLPIRVVFRVSTSTARRRGVTVMFLRDGDCVFCRFGYSVKRFAGMQHVVLLVLSNVVVVDNCSAVSLE